MERVCVMVRMRRGVAVLHVHQIYGVPFTALFFYTALSRETRLSSLESWARGLGVCGTGCAGACGLWPVGESAPVPGCATMT